jgi:hypothetical protein
MRCTRQLIWENKLIKSTIRSSSLGESLSLISMIIAKLKKETRKLKRSKKKGRNSKRKGKEGLHLMKKVQIKLLLLWKKRSKEDYRSSLNLDPLIRSTFQRNNCSYLKTFMIVSPESQVKMLFTPLTSSLQPGRTLN